MKQRRISRQKAASATPRQSVDGLANLVPSSFLRERTITKAVRYYANAVADFQGFATNQLLPLVEWSQIDEAMMKFFDHLYFLGDGYTAGRNTLFGYLHLCTSENGNSRNRLPLATKALAGWRKAAPLRQRDPIPWVLVCLFAEWLISQGRLLAALALMFAFDTYLRMHELCGLTKESLLRPSSRLRKHYGARWTLRLFPEELSARSKTGQDDLSLVIGDVARPFLSVVCSWLSSRPGASESLFRLQPKDVSDALQSAVKHFGLERLRITPHCLRHGGASEDYLHKLRDLNGIKERGFWSSLSSVNRYKKHAKILKQVSLLSRCQAEDANRAALNIEHTVLTAIRTS